jgi:WD40 repeat protein
MRIGIFDARRNAEARAFSRFKDSVNSVAWRGDGRLLTAATGKGTVVALDASTRATLRSFVGHTAAARTAGFVRGNDSAALVYSSGDDAALRLWDVATGACVSVREGVHGDYVRASAAPTAGGGGLLGGAVFATGSYDHTVRLWDVRALRGEAHSAVHGSSSALNTSTSGATEVLDGSGSDSDDDDDDDAGSESLDGDNNDIKDSEDEEMEEEDDVVFGEGRGSGSSSSALLGSSGGAGCVLSVDHGEPVTSVVLLRGGAALASAGGSTVKIWDVLGGGRLLASFSSHSKLVTSLALDGTGARLLSAGLDGVVKMHDAATWAVTHTARFPGASLVAMAMPSDNSRFAVGAADGTLWVRSRALRLGDALVERRAAGLMRAGSYRYFLRGRGGAGARADAETLTRKPKLRSFERSLKAFAHAEALDAALAGAPAPVLAALLRELLARGALTSAVSGREAPALEPLLSFLTAKVAHPRYAALCVDVADAVADAYAPALAAGGAAGGDSVLATLLVSSFEKISAAVTAELRLGDALLGAQGQLEVLLGAAGPPT